MNFYEHNLYQEETRKIADNPAMEALRGKSIVITGARGLIGGQLIDAIMYANGELNLNCTVYAVGRNAEAARQRFPKHFENELFHYVEADINRGVLDIAGDIDYCVHGASNTHPVYYSTRPVETILTNTLGTNNTLQFAVEHHCKRYIFLSTVEVYGENVTKSESFSEGDLGYIDCNTLRAGYPESKRTGETLCQAYRKQYGLDCVIPRLSRCYGPGLLGEDSKAMSQFIKKGVAGEDIVLKSEGTQFYSYTYGADAVDAIVTLLANGQDGEAYNIISNESDITLKELAELIASEAGRKVVFDLPDAAERAGYSKATKAILNASKIHALPWHGSYTMKDGISRTMRILKSSTKM